MKAAIQLYAANKQTRYAVNGSERFVDLIDCAPLSDGLKNYIHVLRRYRNRWVHVDDPRNDSSLIDKPEEAEREPEGMAFFAARAQQRIIYENH
ncbi:hypothetical protein R75483_02824 [Paraburkholderia domus]|nr:hypothetical protein R75483_02824 [Paraburkholderia domus]